MTSNHKYFESLCAFAISDELIGPELVELHQHSLVCISCRNRIHEMTRIDACLSLSHAFTRRNRRLPKGTRERFIARAIKEGVPLKSASTAGLGNLGLASALFIILLVTAAHQNRAILETSCGCRSVPRCAAGRSCSRRKPYTGAFYDESSLGEKRSATGCKVTQRPGGVAARSIIGFPGQEIWSLARPSGSFPKPLFSSRFLFAALHVGSDAVGRRPAVILA